MTTTDKVQEKLENYPQMRERRFSRDWLAEEALADAGLLLKWIDGKSFSLQDLLDFHKKYDTWRHAWDEVTRENPKLQGEDYADGKILAQKVQVERGYMPGFHSLNKKVKEEVFEFDTPHKSL